MQNNFEFHVKKPVIYKQVWNSIEKLYKFDIIQVFPVELMRREIS
jgi:hypothetical protein